MSTYPGSGATRESISLDEDELSDVEDEVFIRDGRNGFKFAEDRCVKRPLMAPRRKLGKPNLASRLKNRPPCRVLCVPCCYAFAALSVFLGLIMLVIILVSLFPLPLDKLRMWIASRNSYSEASSKILPCRDLNVTEIWSVTLPKLTSESTMRALDVNLDGIDDIIFGFGIGEEVLLPEQWFCPMFLGVKLPCQGGVIALDGLTGQPIWRRWFHHSVFTIQCTADITEDGIFDCIASGKGGILCAINGHDGSIIWEFMNNKTSPVIDIYAGSFIPDQDGDKISDIIASHTIQKGRSRFGFILIISGKTGSEIVKVSTPNSAEIYYAPQLFVRFNGENSLLFGTGGQNSAGALYMIGLHDIGMKNINPFLIYEDPKKGILSPVVLVDITGDKIEDIISAMYNSTIVAFDGITFKQLWNYTIPNSETVSVPTPGYFNSDNITDFLVKYQVGLGFPVYYYSQTIIIDGKTGKPIYKKPIVDTAGEQLHGLTIRMEDYGNDIFLYWLSDCKNNENQEETYEFISGSNIWQKTRADLCKLRFNSTKITKLYGMNQYNEPPGILLYTSETHEAIEYNNSRTPLQDVRVYLKENPDFNTLFKSTNPTLKLDDNMNFKKLTNLNPKSKTNPVSNFRHRDDGQTLLKDFTKSNQNAEPPNPINNANSEIDDKYEYDESWNQNPEMLDPQLDYVAYSDNDRDSLLNNKQISSNMMSNRDARSKNPENSTDTLLTDDYDDEQKSKKKDLGDETPALTPNDYKNIYAARNRLLHDLNELPSEILRQTFEKNKALRQSRDSNFDQDKKSGKEVEKKEVKNTELPETLWDLESEKELEDKENGYYRGKRETDEKINGIPKVTSTGVLLKPLTVTKTKNAIDLVFATYWLLPKLGAQVLIDKDKECIRQKMINSASSKDYYQNLDKSALQDLFTKMCLEERGIMLKQVNKVDKTNDDLKKSPYFGHISQLTLGQMTVYRIRLECKCEIILSGERCAQFLDEQSWSSYMGKLGDGYFKIR